MPTFFSKVPNAAPTAPRQLPAIDTLASEAPRDYLAPDGLVDAVNVALLLGQPILVTGDPGTGKTQLGAAIAWQLGYPLHRFDAKSDSRARDLFYTYDALGHFRAPAGSSADARPWMTWSALGQAILHACPFDSVAGLLPEGAAPHTPHRSVVLIDEIDKAPRDFPNDLLAELENLYFRVPELKNRLVKAPAEFRPVVVVTSNSERALPDAFLRRCVYYHIPFPDPATLESIVLRRLPSTVEGRAGLLATALRRFAAIRDLQPPLKKPPATAELLAWIRALRAAAPDAQDPLGEDPDLLRRTLPVLVKTQDDLERVLLLYPPPRQP